MAESAEVVGVKEKCLVALVRGDVDFGAHDVVDVRRSRAAAADDAELAEGIAAKHERDGSSAPGWVVIESLESRVSPKLIAIACGPECAVVILVSLAIR